MTDHSATSDPPPAPSPVDSRFDFANLVFLNVATQAPIKLTSTNFFTWHSQWNALLYGYALTGYVDASLPCPDSSSTQAYMFWTRQDQLLFGSLLASLSRDIAPTVASAQRSKVLWDKLSVTYAKPSRSRIMRLRQKLLAPQGSRSLTTFMFDIKAAADELALLNEPIKDEDITIYVLSGLHKDLRDISASIRSRDTEISFEDLHERLLEHAAFLGKSDSHDDPPMEANNVNRNSGSGYNRFPTSRRNPSQRSSSSSFNP